MSLDGEPVFRSDFILELFNARVFEFNDPAAGDTDQVIMVFALVAGFIACLTITKMTLLGNAALNKATGIGVTKSDEPHVENKISIECDDVRSLGCFLQQRFCVRWKEFDSSACGRGRSAEACASIALCMESDGLIS